MFGAKKLGRKIVEALKARGEEIITEARSKDGSDRLIGLMRGYALQDIAGVFERVLVGETDDGDSD